MIDFYSMSIIPSGDLKPQKLDCIMIIDDDTTTNYLNKRLIKKMEVADKLVIHKNGKEALEYLTNPSDENYKRPSLIFLDINMPVMNGFEFLNAYNKLSDGQKASEVVVMLTTSLLEKDQEEAANLGVKEYLVKPLTQNKIESLISNYFG